MRMNGKIATTAGAVLTAAFLAACSDSPMAPAASSKLTSTRPSFITVDQIPAGFAPEAGKIKVCKVWDNPGAGTIPNTTINRVGNDVTPTAATLTLTAGPYVLGHNQCANVATSTEGNGIFDDVSLTETVPAGHSLVQVQRFDFGGATSVIANGAAIGFNTFHGSTIVFTNHFTPPPGNEGCTPGYWKQEQHFGSWAPVALNTTFTSVFGAGIFGGTLLEALGQNGGGIDALIRHGAAAYLNAQNATVDYQYSAAQVIDIVQGDGAFAGLSIEARKNLLDAANNGVGGCPLNRDEL
jgi:hypothetical protein